MQKNRFLKYFLILAVVTGGIFAFAASAVAVIDTTAPVVTNVIPADGSTIYTNVSSTVYYQYGNATPMVIKADYSDEAGGSGVDATSVMVHLDIANMLDNCPVQTASHVECVATAADLFPGTHPVDVYVSDLVGNPEMHRTWVTVAVDDASPSYSNLSPAAGTVIYTSQLNSASTNDLSALRFDYDIGDPAPSSGVAPMSHVNDTARPSVTGAMISNTSCVKTYSPDGTTVTHYSCQVNRAKLLHLGDNTLSALLKDRVGNESINYSDPASLSHYTVIDDVVPAVSDVTADATAISAAFADPLPTNALSTNLASGINTGSVTVNVDGNPVPSCTATATGVTCPTPAGLAPGTYPVDVSVADTAGNSGSGSGSLTIEPPPCSPSKPGLSVSAPFAFWASYADYEAKILSVNWTISNSGPDAASNVQITGSSDTNGVIATNLPASAGDIANGASGVATVTYSIPPAVGSWRTTMTASAQDCSGATHTYP